MIAIFLPVWDSTGAFSTVKENTLVQQGDWVFGFCGLFGAAAAYRSYSSGRRGYAAIVFGLIALGFAIKIGVNKSERTLVSLANPSEPGTVVSPGIGVYVAGAAGVIMAYGGLQIWKSPLASEAAAEAVSQGEPTKKCPDCAETILAEARVCKHCGYRFA